MLRRILPAAVIADGTAAASASGFMLLLLFAVAGQQG
jgi:hypothetical protein